MEKNKYLKIGILSLFFVFAFVGFSFAQVTLSLRYSNTDSKYHVFLTATQALQAVSNPKLTDGSTLITVIAPTGGNLTVGTVTSVSPSGSWDLTTTQRNNGDVGSGAPANTDFFAFTPAGDFTSLNYTVGQEVELFNFDVTGVCTGSLDILPSAGQTAGGGTQNIGSYYSVKGYAGSIGTNHFSSTYNMSAACPAAPASNLITSIGQPVTPFVAGTPSTVPVTVTNVGTAPDNGPITTTITLPVGFSTPASFPTVAGTTCTTAGQIVTCITAGPLSQTAPNNAVVLNLPVTAAPSTVGVTPTPTTTATTGSPNEPATNATNNAAMPMSPTMPVAAAPASNLITSIGQPVTPFVAGTPSTVPVTVTNIGTAPDNGPITTTITLPVGFSTPASFPTVAGTTCTTAGQIVTCITTGPLSQTAPNNAVVLNLPVTAAPSTVGVTPTPTTTATTGSPNEPAANATNNAAMPMSPTTPVAAAPASNLITSIGQPVTPFVAGTPSTVPVTVTNIGTAPDNGPITTTITLPVGFSTPASFPTVAGTTCTTAGQIVTCITTGPLSHTAPNNAVVLNLPVTAAPSTVGVTPTPTTTATTGSPNEPATNATNNAAMPMSPTTPVAASTAPDVVTTIGQPLPVLVVGQTSNLPVTVTNQGTAPATGPITTTITLPAGVTTSSVFVSSGFTCSTVLQVVTCFTSGPLTHLTPSNTVTIQVPITPDASIVGTNPVFNATTAVQNEPAATLSNNTSAPTPTTSAVAPVPASNIIVTIGQPATPFVAGSPSNVPVTISNIGNISDAGAFTTTITLPAGFSTTSGNFSPVVGTTCSTVGQVVTCSTTGPLSSVVGSNTKVFNLPITAAASTIGTTPTTTASVSSPNEPAANNTNNTSSMLPATAVVAAPAPDLVTVIGQPLTPFVAGSSSIVPVTVTNQGTAPANGPIATTITLPAGMSAPALFTSNGNTCTTTGQVIACSHPGPISNVSPSNSTIIEVPVTPTAATVGTKPGPFTATPTAPNEPAGNTGNNAAPNMTPTTSVAAAPIISVKVAVKLFLQGAYDSNTGLMRDDLRTKGFVPTAQPYSALARTSYHTGTETTTAAVLSATGSNAIVDWVLLELRTGTGAATRVATRAALVQRDGDVVDVDGVSAVEFVNRTAGNYYVVATHRNHLGIMSEIGVALAATPNTVDFTGAYDGYGNNAQKAIGNLNALWAGNANQTGITHRNLIFSGANNDPDGVKNDVLTAAANAASDFSFVPTGYHLGDTNLDGDVKYQGPNNDVDSLIFFNVLTHPSNTGVSKLYIVSEQH